MGPPRLLRLIAGLPPDGALARAEGRKDLGLLFHEWAHTFIQFMAGKRVRTPVMVEQPQRKGKKVNDEAEIKAWFERHGLVQA